MMPQPHLRSEGARKAGSAHRIPVGMQHIFVLDETSFPMKADRLAMLLAPAAIVSSNG
jgi:hypothetical protein